MLHEREPELHSARTRAPLAAGAAPAQLGTSLTNGDFSTNGDVVYDNTVDNWGEQEIYGGEAPDGHGAAYPHLFVDTAGILRLVSVLRL